MAKRIIKPSVITIKKYPFKKNFKSSKVSTASAKRAADILRIIRGRENKPNIWKVHPVEPERASPSADDWQKFKRDFVDEYAGEKVKETGMTHSEFFDYFTKGTRECEEAPDGKLKELLRELYEKDKE